MGIEQEPGGQGPNKPLVSSPIPPETARVEYGLNPEFATEPSRTSPLSEPSPLSKTVVFSHPGSDAERGADSQSECHLGYPRFGGIHRKSKLSAELSEDDESEELTLAEAARQFGYDRNTLLRAIQRGSLSGRQGTLEVKAWFVRRQDLEDYIKRAMKKGRGPGTRLTRHSR